MQDEELSKFYKDLMVSEANHYTLFLRYARKYMDRKTVDAKWKSLLAFEAEMMKSRGHQSNGSWLIKPYFLKLTL
jgi:tRNA-(ms[2]io[6]A)-hydroxylase